MSAGDPERVPSDASLPGVGGLGILAAGSWDLYRRTFPRLLVPFALLYGADLGLRAALSALDEISTPAAIGWRVVVTVLGSFAAGWAAIVLAQEVVGKPVPRRAIGGTLRTHLRELVTAGLLASLIVLLFDLLLIGELLAVAVFGPPIVVHAIVLEYRPFRDSVARAGALLSGLWARAGLVLLGAALAAVVIQMVLALIAGAAAQRLEGTSLRVAAVAFLFAASTLVAPLVAAAQICLLFDLRARKENLDREGFARERAEAMDERPVVGSTLD